MTAAEHRLDGGNACLLITGAPGAGKSTISRLIADELTQSALMDSYFVGRLVAGGYVWPLGEPADEAARQVRLLNTNLCALAANFADAGFTPIIDIVLPDGEQLNTYRRALASRRLLLVVLDPGIEVCRYRNEIRPPQQQFFFSGYDELRSSMRRHFGSLGWWFDNSDLTAEQTAELSRSSTRPSCVPSWRPEPAPRSAIWKVRPFGSPLLSRCWLEVACGVGLPHRTWRG